MNLINDIKKLVRIFLHFGFSKRKQFPFSFYDKWFLSLYYWSIQPSSKHPRFCGKIEFEVHFDEGSQSPIKIQYGVLDRPLQRRWLELVRQDMQLGRSLWFGGMFFGKLFCNEVAAQRKLVELIKRLSAFIEVPKDIQELTTFSDESLHRLHYLKEVCTTNRSEPVNEQYAILDHINYLIHQTEFNRTIYALPQTGAINCVFLPPIKAPISWKENLEFSPICDLGWLYMDYGTNGVPMLDGFWGNADHRPVPQTEISSGCQLYFYDRAAKMPLADFEHWLRTKWQTSVFDLENRIGHICLGRVLHDDPKILRLQLEGATRIQVLSAEFNSEAP